MGDRWLFKTFCLILCVCASVTHSHVVVTPFCEANTPASGAICCACEGENACSAFRDTASRSDRFPGLEPLEHGNDRGSAGKCGCQEYCCKVLSTLVFLPVSIQSDPSRGGSHAGLGATFPFPQLDLPRAIFHPPRA